MDRQISLQTKTDTISRETQILKTKHDQLLQEQELKIRSETRLKIGNFFIFQKNFKLIIFSEKQKLDKIFRK